MADAVLGNLYQINKQFIKQLPLMTDEDLKKAQNKVNEWVVKYNDRYFMLYGKEISYFTVFKLSTDTKEFFSLGEAVITILNEFSSIYSIDNTDNNEALEIWIKYNDEPTMLQLFPYDVGIVEVR